MSESKKKKKKFILTDISIWPEGQGALILLFCCYLFGDIYAAIIIKYIFNTAWDLIKEHKTFTYIKNLPTSILTVIFQTSSNTNFWFVWIFIQNSHQMEIRWGKREWKKVPSCPLQLAFKDWPIFLHHIWSEDGA